MRCEEEENVAWTPQDAGHRCVIRALEVKGRKDAQHNVCQREKSDRNVDGDGHLRVNRMKGYHKAGEKQVHGEMKECRSYLDQKAHSVDVRAEEQEPADACAMIRLARDFRGFDVSACPLLKQCRNQCRCDAKYKAYHPHCVDPDHGCTWRWLIRRVGIGAIWVIGKLV
jgi:hypothetical protein